MFDFNTLMSPKSNLTKFWVENKVTNCSSVKKTTKKKKS